MAGAGLAMAEDGRSQVDIAAPSQTETILGRLLGCGGGGCHSTGSRCQQDIHTPPRASCLIAAILLFLAEIYSSLWAGNSRPSCMLIWVKLLVLDIVDYGVGRGGVA